MKDERNRNLQQKHGDNVGNTIQECFIGMEFINVAQPWDSYGARICGEVHGKWQGVVKLDNDNIVNINMGKGDN